MNDRELLELAAKAAGIKYEWREFVGPWVGEFYSGKKWDPLEDDGDALRLAVKLGMIVHIDYDHCECVEISHAQAGIVFESLGYKGEDKSVIDPYAATRRAIVSAAAEIARNMP